MLLLEVLAQFVTLTEGMDLSEKLKIWYKSMH